MTDPRTSAIRTDQPAAPNGVDGRFSCAPGEPDDLAVVQTIDDRIMADRDCREYLRRMRDDMRRRLGGALVGRLSSEPEGLVVSIEFFDRETRGPIGDPLREIGMRARLSRPAEARLVPMLAMPDGSWRSVRDAAGAFAARLWSDLRRWVRSRMPADSAPPPWREPAA